MLNCSTCVYLDAENHSCKRRVHNVPGICPYAEEKDFWTAVTDRLPDLHEDSFDDGEEYFEFQISDPVLVVFNHDEIAVSCYTKDDHFSGWVMPLDSRVLHSVTHWMQLPKLPKEVS